MGVYGAENFKTLLLRQFLPDQFQIISATTLGGPSQTLFSEFWISPLLFLKKNFKFSLPLE